MKHFSHKTTFVDLHLTKDDIEHLLKGENVWHAETVYFESHTVVKISFIEDQPQQQ